MSILQTDKRLKDNSLSKDKRLPSRDNSPSKDKLIPKGENTYDIFFFLEKETEKIPINRTVILSDMEKGYLAFSKFIYNNPNGKGYYQTSIESNYPRIMITDQADPIFIMQ